MIKFDSEEYLVLQERLYFENKRKEDSIIEKYRERINSYLQKNDEVSRAEFLKMFRRTELLNIAHGSNYWAEIIMIATIYELEKNHGVNITIMDAADGREALLSVLHEIKYRLIALEFTEDQEEDFIKLVETYKLSPFAIGQMVLWNNYDKKSIFMRLEKLFKNEMMIHYSAIMLAYLNNLKAGENE